MTRTTAIVGVLMAVCGVVTAAAAFAIARGWNTGPWTETLFLVGALIVVVATGWILVAFTLAASLRAAAFFAVPEQPPGLDRISRVIEQERAEQDAAAARRPREPPPEIVSQLRAITGHGHH